jgi:hypothetical protein
MSISCFFNVGVSNVEFVICLSMLVYQMSKFRKLTEPLWIHRDSEDDDQNPYEFILCLNVMLTITVNLQWFSKSHPDTLWIHMHFDHHLQNLYEFIGVLSTCEICSVTSGTFGCIKCRICIVGSTLGVTTYESIEKVIDVCTFQWFATYGDKIQTAIHIKNHIYIS